MQELDLNLLTALDVLLKEQSVTLAAQKMHLSVPAMSRTLSRIRTLIGDPILVRAGMRLVPTTKALELQPRLLLLMDEARAFVYSANQIPLSELERSFTVRGAESFHLFADDMNVKLEREAPRLQIRIVTRATEGLDALRTGTVHLDIGNVSEKSPEVRLQKLFRCGFMGVARGGHPVLYGRVTAKRFASHRHVDAAGRTSEYSPIDLELGKLRVRRNVALMVPDVQSAMLAAASSDLITSIPSFLVPFAASIGLRTFQLPIPIRPITIFQAWHPRFDADPAHQFLRRCISEFCRV